MMDRVLAEMVSASLAEQSNSPVQKNMTHQRTFSILTLPVRLTLICPTAVRSADVAHTKSVLRPSQNLPR